MHKEAVIQRSNGITLYSKKVNPKTSKRRVLGRFKSMEEAKKRERQIQYFKHQEDALVDFAKQSIDETLLKEAALRDYLRAAGKGMRGAGRAIRAVSRGTRKAFSLPAAAGSVLVSQRKRALPALAGAALGGLTGAAAAPLGYKTRTGLAGAAAGGVGGAFHPAGALAGPAAGIAVGRHYKKRAEEAIRKRKRARRRAAREAIGSTYGF